jgi:hypothetical protein
VTDQPRPRRAVNDRPARTWNARTVAALALLLAGLATALWGLVPMVVRTTRVLYALIGGPLAQEFALIIVGAALVTVALRIDDGQERR